MLSTSQDKQLIALPQDSHDQQLWIEINRLESRLRQIARQPITENIQSSDELKALAFEFVYQQWFDGIHGGFYHLIHEVCQFSCYQNALIARALLNVDRVVLDGQLRFVGLNILNNLVIHHFDPSRGLFFGDSICGLKDSPICYAEEEIIKILDANEIRLFGELTGNFSTLIDEERYYISRFTQPLKVAASRAQIEYKHAQILESVIRNKLNNYSITQQKFSELPVSLIEQAEILVVLTQAIIFSDLAQFQETVDKLTHYIQAKVKTNNEIETKIASLYSLTYTNQIKIDYALLNKIANDLMILLDSVELQNNILTLSEQSKYYLRCLRVIFATIFNKKDDYQLLVEKLIELQLPLHSYRLMEPKIIIIDDNLAGHSTKQSISSRYDSRLMVFHI
ncbi:hypothetical protein FLL45_12220 [Aliikangiella marina]|uniref:Uncharacterized protein n=1 Tax=Aliikangiella marina TaxID=1712262 RepID=A0A545T8T0_9GAMM|nr:hypothetical protein [Aliikangiella marina]TQV73633.1 hypothetical protein FLL45_12220 [Aliikangiella marina]